MRPWYTHQLPEVAVVLLQDTFAGAAWCVSHAARGNRVDVQWRCSRCAAQSMAEFRGSPHGRRAQQRAGIVLQTATVPRHLCARFCGTLQSVLLLTNLGGKDT